MASGATLSGCQPEAPQATATVSSAATGEMPPIRVTPITPQKKHLVRTIELPGRVEAYEVTPLHSKVTGFVQQVTVDIGDTIQGPRDGQPGTELCELLVPELKEELAEKNAAIEQTKAEVLQSDAGIKVAQSMVRSAEAGVDEAKAAAAKEEAMYAKWKSEFARVSQLAAPESSLPRSLRRRRGNSTLRMRDAKKSSLASERCRSRTSASGSHAGVRDHSGSV